MTVTALAIKKGQIHWEPEIYAAEVTALLNVLARCPDKSQRLLLVGHNPGLEDLVVYLAADTGELPARGKLMPTGAVVGIRLPESCRFTAGLRPHRDAHGPESVTRGESHTWPLI